MILDDITAKRQLQLEREKSVISDGQMKRLAEKSDMPVISFSQALKGGRLSVICEVKKASPSKGIIKADFDPAEIAREYESAGADAISCLTEEFYFKGSSEYLREIRRCVGIPILRKDFVFDEYQIYEAKYIGANAVLLIAAVLSPAQLDRLYKLARSLGLECLIEVHNTQELEKISALDFEILGINNRNLKTFEVDLNTTARLKEYIPEDKIIVSESGIKTNADMKAVRSLGADAALIGETLMRSSNIAAELSALRKGV
ncbi:indole-3-glycerol phosphate synthase TrpC [Ruminococcus sp. Marseille-P6503]|uniref:indole-3-glycerol phosphate synthase TrpC n=1 Tax=Ruminococcus sp. Marseille-P6503 TaxID=2364796 RepID=UPI000F53585B|nr:indole-3-glycerol phosphate synthase TrpC [Ruminococcus sp. Marseille-P6503]